MHYPTYTHVTALLGLLRRGALGCGNAPAVPLSPAYVHSPLPKHGAVLPASHGTMHRPPYCCRTTHVAVDAGAKDAASQPPSVPLLLLPPPAGADDSVTHCARSTVTAAAVLPPAVLLSPVEGCCCCCCGATQRTERVAAPRPTRGSTTSHSDQGPTCSGGRGTRVGQQGWYSNY